MRSLPVLRYSPQRLWLFSLVTTSVREIYNPLGHRPADFFASCHLYSISPVLAHARENDSTKSTRLSKVRSKSLRTPLEKRKEKSSRVLYITTYKHVSRARQDKKGAVYTWMHRGCDRAGDSLVYCCKDFIYFLSITLRANKHVITPLALESGNNFDASVEFWIYSYTFLFLATDIR